MGVGVQRHAPAALPPEKTRYPLCRWLGGPRGRSGQVRKISHHTVIRSPDRPARSESLYRLSYRGPYKLTLKGVFFDQYLSAYFIEEDFKTLYIEDERIHL